MKERGFTGELPEIDGHIFFTGRDYVGPCFEVISDNIGNIPQPTELDFKRTWENVYKQLPSHFQNHITATDWAAMRTDCVHPNKGAKKRNKVNTAAVYTLRKLLHGMIIGPLDKNNGECSVACPVSTHNIT